MLHRHIVQYRVEKQDIMNKTPIYSYPPEKAKVKVSLKTFMFIIWNVQCIILHHVAAGMCKRPFKKGG